MKKLLLLNLIFVLISACSSGVTMRGIASNDDNSSMTKSYLNRLKSVMVGAALNCEGEKSNMTVIFHRKDGEQESRVSLYGTLNNKDIFIPYYNGSTVASKSNHLRSNVTFGEVMKEFDLGEAYNQEFILNSDDLKLAIKLTKKRTLRKKLVIDQDLLKCTALD